jgi:hypothetical protein
MNLNENYRIVYDSENCILQYFDLREKKIKDTGKTETFEFTENFYYPNLKTALCGFLHKQLWSNGNAESILEKIVEVKLLIKSINK